MAEQRDFLNVVCVRVGDRYGPEYVEILADMVARNLSTIDHAIWCITDDPASLPEGVNAIAADPSLPGYWQKVRLFAGDMPWEPGARVLYLDLDVAVVGRLEDFADRKGIARDVGWPCFNSSVMCWDHGEHRDVWERFTPEVMSRSPGPIVPASALAAGMPNGGDQEWITEVGGWDVLPAEWCLSYRWQAKDNVPAAARVVQFHGHPKPAEVREGWVPNVWKVGGFTSLPLMRGANVSNEALLANVRENVARDLEWFTRFGGRGPHEDTAVIVCGGPSMKKRLAEIRDRQRRGQRIITVSNALRFLVERGITPDAHVMLDARPENVEFLKDAPEGVSYFLASQCHPSLFDALKDRRVVVWHNVFGDGEELRELLQPYWETRPVVGVPGGGTVGLRALTLCWLSGYRRVHVYGMDGSYDGDAHHAFPQALNDGERVIEVDHGGRRYRCAMWMCRQAEEFRETYASLSAEGVDIFVHGEGLIPDIWRTLRAERRAAERGPKEPMLEQIGGWWWPSCDRRGRRAIERECPGSVTQFLAHVRGRHTIVQAGANVGLYPLALADHFQRVITAEPDPLNAECLARNLKARDSLRRVTALRVGFGEAVGSGAIERPEPDNCGAHRLRPGGGGVRIVTIDSLNLQACDAIWLDIEGQELAALKGAEATIRRLRPVVAVEDKGLSEAYGVPAGEVGRWLEARGYELVDQVGRDKVYRSKAR